MADEVPNYWKEQWERCGTYEILGTGLTIMGFSIAARMTSFYIPGLKVMLDGGIPHEFMDTGHILVTHGHLDHVKGIIEYVLATKTFKPVIYVPGTTKPMIMPGGKETKPSTKASVRLREAINGMYQLSTCNYVRKVENRYEMVDVYPKKILRIKTRSGRILLIEVISCTHSVPCVGYGISEIRKKLKPEFEGKTKKEIGEIVREKKKAGIKDFSVSEQTTVPLLMFIGDTDRRVLSDKSIKKYPAVMVECSFLYPEHVDEAIKDKHMHWDHLKEYVIANPEITFILYHFSMRYTSKEVDDFFKNVLAEGITNIYPWIVKKKVSEAQGAFSRIAEKDESMVGKLRDLLRGHDEADVATILKSLGIEDQIEDDAGEAELLVDIEGE